MRLNVKDKEEAAFQMAPMIDMVFLLLVFFMCSSHLSQEKSKKLEMPIAAKALVPKERPDRWIVNIDVMGDIYKGEEQQISLDELKAGIEAKLKENPKIKVYIRADAKAKHRSVKKVMNTLASAGISDFIFGVYQPQTSQKKKMH